MAVQSFGFKVYSNGKKQSSSPAYFTPSKWVQINATHQTHTHTHHVAVVLVWEVSGRT